MSFRCNIVDYRFFIDFWLNKYWTMKQLISDNRHFLLPYVAFITIFTVFAILYSRVEMHIWANQFNSPFFDNFFKYITHLGDGISIAILALILIFFRYRYAVAFLLASLVTSSIVHLFKRILMEKSLRPNKYFDQFETYKLYLVEGFKLRGEQSFPSGHASTAFNIFLMLAILTKNKYLKITYFILAFAVAYSRVYLSMHFFIDIAVGSFIAIISILVMYNWSLGWKKGWLDSSVLIKIKASK